MACARRAEAAQRVAARLGDGSASERRRLLQFSKCNTKSNRAFTMKISSCNLCEEIVLLKAIGPSICRFLAAAVLKAARSEILEAEFLGEFLDEFLRGNN